MKYFTPVFILRFGLGLTFVYAGIHALASPETWAGFVPGWVGAIMPLGTFLRLHAVFDLVIGILLLSGILVSLTSLIAAFALGGIMILSGVDVITFRDFGLLAAAVALLMLSKQEKAGAL